MKTEKITTVGVLHDLQTLVITCANCGSASEVSIEKACHSAKNKHQLTDSCQVCNHVYHDQEGNSLRKAVQELCYAIQVTTSEPVAKFARLDFRVSKPEPKEK